MTTYSVPIHTTATTAVDFTTDIDPVKDPEGFEKAFYAANIDFPNANVTNDFETDGEWEMCVNEDGSVEAYEL